VTNGCNRNSAPSRETESLTNIFTGIRIHAIDLASRWIETRGARWRGARQAIVAFEAQCGRGKDFFIWIRRNPLISPDSAKGIQGNPSFFSWIPLDFLGFIWQRNRTGRFASGA
jgi:hypothetical protein